MPGYRSFWRALAVLALAVLVSGCAPGSATSTQSAGNSTSVNPSPTTSTGGGSVTIVDGPGGGPPSITLKDTSPGQLKLVMGLNIGGYDPSSRDTTELDIYFMHQGAIVQFVAGEHITCNGLAVPGFGSNFDLKVPSETFSGKLITCTYYSGKTSATFSFTCPLAPAILSPQENAQVPRSKQTPVRYRISPDGPFYVIALRAPQKAWTPNAASQPNPVMLDTSAFSAGPGSIAINQYFTLPDLRGPAFQSVHQESGEGTYEIEVSWA